jgi:two-component system chemotaxis response regulator CheY
MKILIVEDNTALQELMKLYLADYGPCDVADNGLQGYEAVKRAIEAGHPYDLICMDIMMPELNGLEAMKKIRLLEFKHFKAGLTSAKIIMVTAKDMAKDLVTAYHAGCEAYITKPFTREKLMQQIRELGLMTKPASAPESDFDNNVPL